MKVALLLSGGVDSSVALKLLQNEGHDITAFYLKIWLEDELSFLGECPWEDDLCYAREVCKMTNTPLEVLSLQREYWDIIVTYALQELKAGRTPNSDIFCNRLIKFGIFYDKINKSFEKIASGHYARIKYQNDRYVLLKSPDPIKDQTYFLAYLKQEQLSRALFPLGKFKKKEVRDLALSFNLPNKYRKDSQGICFLGQVKYSDFIEYHLGERPGDFIDLETHQIVGKHRGYWYYTIGQRQGLGLSGGPWFVVSKDIDKNLIYLSRNPQIRDQYNKEFSVTQLNWIAESPPEIENLQVKIRHGKEYHHCTITFKEDNCARVSIKQPDQGIAPGQFAVFYDEEICLGAGIISGN